MDRSARRPHKKRKRLRQGHLNLQDQKPLPPIPPAPQDIRMTEEEETLLPVLYQDERYIAIHKPSGLLVHRSPIDRSETRFAIQLLRDQIGQRVYPAHRIDRPTSGVLLFGLDPEAMTALSILFQERAVKKTYIAMTRGHTPESGTIDSPLHKFLDTDGKIKSEETQESTTHYKRIASVEHPYPTERYATTRYSLVELHPLTGRRHQLRRHLSHIRHPIIGDVRHGCNKANKLARKNFDIHRLLLAATNICFEHPFTKEEIRIDCPLEESFQAALNKTNLHF